uniref:Uncharacterized protein n=1 Tax=Arundo donax TaxID=35708 RepID=A0A0A8Y111_ARUDO
MAYIPLSDCNCSCSYILHMAEGYCGRKCPVLFLSKNLMVIKLFAVYFLMFTIELL